MKKAVIFLAVIFVFINQTFVSALGTSAKGAVVLNGDTGEILWETNCEKRLPMASTTKIMTGLLLCENGGLDREITVKDEMVRVEGTSMGLLAGDRVTLHDLLYGLMLSSGNDAANVIAYTLGGSVNGFVKLMNQKAEELGLKNTHFDTPSGLDGETHYTSAYDLASLARYALNNEEFAKAVSSKSAVLNYGNPPYRRTLTNHNKMLKIFEGAIGVKTGFTKKSGRCLVSAAKRDGEYVIAVTLSDPNDWKDHTAMLEYGFEKISITQAEPEKSEYSLPVIGSDTKSIDIKIEPQEFSISGDEKITCQVKLPSFVYAPLKPDEKIGSISYKSGDKTVKEVDILAGAYIKSSEQKPDFKREFKENFKYIFNGLWEK